MTDIMSDAFGREIVARDAFENEGVWLPLLAVHTMNAGQAVIKNKTFTDCVIQGPALIAVLQGTTFDSCNMGAASDARSMLFSPRGSTLVGAIGLEDCKFVRCRFIQIGYTGSDSFLDDMGKSLSNIGQAG